MNKGKKLEILSDSAKYDRCNYVTPDMENYLTGKVKIPGIYHATTTNGCTVPLFKVLMTNKCSNDCRYCINHNKHRFNRVELSPEDLTSIFLDYYQNRYVEGLFLSSGVSQSTEKTMENMIEVTSLLRAKYEYKGYIHLKILPGSSYDLIKRALSLANRVSINIEAATPEGLNELTSTKNYHSDIIKRMKWIKRLLNRDKELAPSGQTTQFIIGATEETDQQILDRANSLYKKLNVKRSYFSPFEPMENTPLESHEEPHPKRTPRLYQADYLLNSYGFDLGELVFDDNDNLKLDADPKYYAALSREELFPVEVNLAPYKELLRVPGIGKISAKRIIQARKIGKCFEKLEELKNIGVVTRRAEPFIKLNKSYQATLEF